MKSIEMNIKSVNGEELKQPIYLELNFEGKSFSESITDEERNMPTPDMDNVVEIEITKYLYKAHCRFKDEYCNLEVYYSSYLVLSETKHYYTVQVGCSTKKVQNQSKNGFAFDSKEKALFNLLKRRERYQCILAMLTERNNVFIEELKQLVK